MRVNFHREVSLTLFYFFFDFPVEYLDLSCHFCYNLLWVIVLKTEQNLKRTVVKIEHFTAVFLYPKERKEVAEMAKRNRTNPVQFYLSDDEQFKASAPIISLTIKPRTRMLISADTRARSSSMAAQDGCLNRQACSILFSFSIHSLPSIVVKSKLDFSTVWQ